MERDMWRKADFWKAAYLFGENFGDLLGSISPSDWHDCGDCGGRGEFQGDPCCTCGGLGMTARKALNLEVEAAAN